MRANGRMYLAAAAALSMMFSGSAGASATVDITEATVSGSTATVKGTVSFPAITSPQAVQNGSKTEFAGAQVADTVGINLVAGKIVPIENGLRFIWEVTNLPDRFLNEGLRMNWAFKIGERQYQLQAKTSNMASLTTVEDPLGHVKQLRDQKPFFQLRGNCTSSYEGTPVAGCYHLAFLTGSFNPAAKQISIDLPYETRDSIGRLVAPDFKPGVVLAESQSANMSIAGCFQAVISNANTCNFINGWSPYFVGGRVQLAVGNHTAAPEEIEFTSAPVAVTNGSFTAAVSGLSASANTVFVRACNGTECSYDSERVVF